jgi:signal transduction histidine kinase
VKFFLPKTLKTRIILILCAFFLLSHIISLIIYENNRDKTILLTEATDLAARIEGIVKLASGFPSEDREEILVAAETQFLAMFPETDLLKDIDCQSNTFSELMSEYLQQTFQAIPGVSADVCLREFDTSQLLSSEHSLRGFDVLVSINFPDSEPTVFHAVLPEGQSLLKDRVIIYLLVSIISALLIAWYLIRKTVGPLERLADAANSFGANIDAPSLDESGPAEVTLAANAFNRMQAHLQQLVHGQTEMLAAISHDLRSAITRLQLRTELLQNEAERDGLLRVIEDMGLMIQSVLDYIRGIDPTETPKKINITALVESLCEDLREEGYAVTFHGEDINYSRICRPAAFRRGLQNLIDNAIKYGVEARVSVHQQDNQFCISVQDSGQGIPEDQLELALKPFYRLEKSRNAATGGIGLGLSVAVNVFRAHGGTLILSNLPAGGLEAKVTFAPEASRDK